MIDRIGQRFGSLVVTHADGKMWLCQCDCGHQAIATERALAAGDATWCLDKPRHENPATAEELASGRWPSAWRKLRHFGRVHVIK